MKKFCEEENGGVLPLKHQKDVNVLKHIVAWTLFFAVLMFFAYCLTHEAKVVNGESMQPTLNETFSKLSAPNNYDIVIINKEIPVKRGDIVVINFSDFSNQHKLIIKRVIAVEGDTLNIDWDDARQRLVVTLNGTVIDEDYIMKNPSDPTKDSSDAEECATKFQSKISYQPLANGAYCWDHAYNYTNPDGSITIPKGCFFALGDNRGNSTDCSFVGPMKTSKIVGVVENVVKNGSFFNKFLRTFFGLKL